LNVRSGVVGHVAGRHGVFDDGRVEPPRLDFLDDFRNPVQRHDFAGIRNAFGHVLLGGAELHADALARQFIQRRVPFLRHDRVPGHEVDVGEIHVPRRIDGHRRHDEVDAARLQRGHQPVEVHRFDLQLVAQFFRDEFGDVDVEADDFPCRRIHVFIGRIVRRGAEDERLLFFFAASGGKERRDQESGQREKPRSFHELHDASSLLSPAKNRLTECLCGIYVFSL